MKWNRLQLPVNDADDDAERASVLSRREVMAGLGMAGVIAMVGPALLTARPAEASPARTNSSSEPDPKAAKPAATAEARSEIAECSGPDATEFSAQRRWRRRWRRGWRRPWRRRRWVVRCRRRWRRGRLVRICRRVWW